MIFEDFSLVYNNLADDISRKLFMKRVEYSISRDYNCITSIDCKTRNLSSDTEYFSENLKVLSGRRVAAFGAGNNGVALARAFHGLFFAMIDNHKKWDNEPYTKLPVYLPDEFIEKYGTDDIVFFITIANENARNEVIKQLKGYGVKQEQIHFYAMDWRNNCSQYFDLFTPKKNEVFVDCGCYDGSTAFRFAGWCGALSYNKIISFEPDPTLYKNCCKILENLGKCELHPYGVSDKSKSVPFFANAQEDARIVTNSDGENIKTIETVSLDEFLKDERVTFIKMDIEGAEYDAIVGASKIIKQQKPRLAICLYHNSDHIITIPKLLLELRPDYKLYIRHYSLMPNETILYAE